MWHVQLARTNASTKIPVLIIHDCEAQLECYFMILKQTNIMNTNN